MKAKVTIENGKTVIILTPENTFEKNLIEKSSGSPKYGCEVTTKINVHENYGSFKNHEIVIDITEVI